MTERRKEYYVRYSNYVVEHLGVKLYQNRPTNALAELVANAWDADAENTWIDIHLEGETAAWFVAVGDDGIGMDPDQVQEEYLVIGRKRRLEGENRSPNKGRPLTGRKGIGKLAPFGISRLLDVLTICDGEATWISIDLKKMLEKAKDPNIQTEYQPKVVYAGEYEGLEVDATETAVNEFVARIASKSPATGSLVVLKDLAFSSTGWSRNFGMRLANRMIPALAEPDFSVFVNDQEIGVEDSLPSHGLRIPNTDWDTITLPNGKEIRAWALVVDLQQHKTTYGEDWTQDHAGVAVYAHRKIAQDRPFFFGLKGREIYSRYLYGVVDADWVDELAEDVISTDRTSLNWDHPDLQELKDEGMKLVRSWLDKAREHLKSKQRKQVEKKIEERLDKVPQRYRDYYSSGEVREMAETILSISPSSSINKVIDITFSAVGHIPSWKMLNDLVETVEEGDLSDEIFRQIVFDFRFFENTNLAQVIARRLRAMKALARMIREGAREVAAGAGDSRTTVSSMHDLFASNPWMLDLGWAAVADELPPQLATQAIGQIDKRLEEKHGEDITEFESWRTIGQKAIDFFMLHVTEFENAIIIVEIKRANKSLTTTDLRQLEDYMDEVRAELVKHEERSWSIQGILIGGRIGPNLRTHRELHSNPAIDVITWDDLLDNAKSSHQEFLAALTMGLHDDPRLETYLQDLGFPEGVVAEENDAGEPG